MKEKTECYVLVFEDKSGSLAMRQELLAKHMAYLEAQHSVELVQGAETLDLHDGKPNGSVIVVAAENLQKVRDFINDDPFGIEGLFQEVRIKRWNYVPDNAGSKT